MSRHGSADGLASAPIPHHISDVVTMPFALQALNLADALEQFEEDLLNLDEALVTQARRQVRVLEQKCRQSTQAFLEVKCRLHDVIGGETS